MKKNHLWVIELCHPEDKEFKPSNTSCYHNEKEARQEASDLRKGGWKTKVKKYREE